MSQLEPIVIDSPPIKLEVCQIKITGKSGFRTCEARHVHCTRCGRRAHKFRKGWTCGLNCVAPGKGTRFEYKAKE